MTQRARKVLDAALRLPETERLQFVRDLLAALEGESTRGADRAWVEVAESRTGELEAGTVTAIPWSQVKRSARRNARG